MSNDQTPSRKDQGRSQSCPTSRKDPQGPESKKKDAPTNRKSSEKLS